MKLTVDQVRVLAEQTSGVPGGVYVRLTPTAASGCGAPSVAFTVTDDRARVLASGGVSCGGTYLVKPVAA